MPLLHRYITDDVFMMTKRSDSDDKSLRPPSNAHPFRKIPHISGLLQLTVSLGAIEGKRGHYGSRNA